MVISSRLDGRTTVQEDPEARGSEVRDDTETYVRAQAARDREAARS
jgi:hypothetical protein